MSSRILQLNLLVFEKDREAAIFKGKQLSIMLQC